MIKVKQFTPPAKYYNLVRKQGEAYLKRNPNPSAHDINRHNYWRFIHNDLYKLYDGVCAYCAAWSPRSQTQRLDNTSIDHFIPKSVEPQLAYAWSNFRLCRARINHNKSDSLNVVDPLFISNGWFFLDFNTFLLYANENLPHYLQDRIEETIAILRLNDDDYVNERLSIIANYCVGKANIDIVKRNYPFIAYEIERTGFDATLKPMMTKYFTRNKNIG